MLHEVDELAVGEFVGAACGFPARLRLRDVQQAFTGWARTAWRGIGRFTGGFTFFGVLFGTMCLNARFGFFKLLASMIDMLLFQFTARIAVQVDALRANFDAVQVTPA